MTMIMSVIMTVMVGDYYYEDDGGYTTFIMKVNASAQMTDCYCHHEGVSIRATRGPKPDRFLHFLGRPYGHKKRDIN